MKLTINLVEEQEQVDNNVIKGTNVIVRMRAINEERSVRSRIRMLTAWDVTTDIHPRTEMNPTHIKITGVGYYSTATDKVEATTADISFQGSPLQVGQVMRIGTDLPYRFQFSGTISDGVIFSGTSTDPTYLNNIWYITYQCSFDGGDTFQNDKYEIKTYMGIPNINTRILPDATEYIPPNTIRPILFEGYSDFKMYKFMHSQSAPANPIAIFGQELYNKIKVIYSNMNAWYVPKVAFIDPNEKTSYNGLVEIPNMTYFGKPVYYGQSLNMNHVKNGQLLYKTGNTPNAQINVLFEGFVTGLLYIK